MMDWGRGRGTGLCGSLTTEGPRNMASDPREAVLDSLCAPPGVVTVSEGSPGGLVLSGVSGGPPFSTDRKAVAFLKERSGARQRLYAVTYPHPQGPPYLGVVGVVQKDDGSCTSMVPRAPRLLGWLVLFVVERGVDVPADVQILSATGELLASHPVFDCHVPPPR